MTGEEIGQAVDTHGIPQDLSLEQQNDESYQFYSPRALFPRDLHLPIKSRRDQGINDRDDHQNVDKDTLCAVCWVNEKNNEWINLNGDSELLFPNCHGYALCNSCIGTLLKNPNAHLRCCPICRKKVDPLFDPYFPDQPDSPVTVASDSASHGFTSIDSFDHLPPASDAARDDQCCIIA